MSNSVDVNALLTGAADDGMMGAQSLNILSGLDDIGTRIQAALGTPADAIQASETVIVRIKLDDSGSMSGEPAAAALAGYNSVIDALNGSKQKSGILFAGDFLNGDIICPYTPLEQVQQLTSSQYTLKGMTPLYDETLAMLADVVAKTKEFSDNGVPCRAVCLIVTDGFNNASRATADKVKIVVKDLLTKNENIIVAAMGICEQTTDATEQARREQEFRDIFESMGIRPQWILTPGNSTSEIRKAFAVFSQSAVRASQNAANFSSSQIGGFGN